MDVQQLINKQTDVSLSIARHVSLEQQEKKSNLILSPLSINVVVSLIAAGASGPTLKQLLSCLKLDSIDDANRLSSEIISGIFADGSLAGGPKLSIANAVWIQEDLPLKPSFQHVLKSFYNATSYQVDFLTKGVWDQKFDLSQTREYDFHLFGEDSVKAPFMTSKARQFIKNFDSFKVLRLPYRQGDDKPQFSMCIFLPHTKDGLPSLVEKLDSEIGFLDKHLPHEKVRVGEFRFPKFKFSFGFEASHTLKNLDVSDVFTYTGLTEMVDSLEEGERLYVSEIFHKSCIEVNEVGTEVVAVSHMDFVADHPFMFVIQEDSTDTVLFIGHVLNPLQG